MLLDINILGLKELWINNLLNKKLNLQHYSITLHTHNPIKKMASLNEKLAESLIQLTGRQENRMLYQDRRTEEIPPHSMFHTGILSINIFILDSERTGRCLRNNLCSSIPEIRQYRINLLFAHLWEGTINKILSMRKVYLF